MPKVPLVFSPNGFTVTATALANPPGGVTPFATNQTAGTSFALHLAAFGQTPSDPVCGIIEEYTGAKSLKFWSQYVDPGHGHAQRHDRWRRLPPPPKAPPCAQAVTFANGQAAVTAKYKDVGRIRIAMKDDTTVNAELPAGITGATANFVVRPYDFVLSDIANSAGTVVNPQAVDASGGVFLAAGAPFRATVTVRDAEGSTTPNYGRESIPETVRLATADRRAAPAARIRRSARRSASARSAMASATGTDFTWSEVGIMRAVPSVGDGSYLTAGDVTGAAQRAHRPVHSEPLRRGAQRAAVRDGLLGRWLHLPRRTVRLRDCARHHGDGRRGERHVTTNYTGAFFKLDERDAPGAQLRERGGPARHVGAAVAGDRSRDRELGRRCRDADVRQRQRARASAKARRKRRSPAQIAARDRRARQRRRRGRRRGAARQSRDVRYRGRHSVHGGAGDSLRPRARRHCRRLRARRLAGADARRVLREHRRGFRRATARTLAPRTSRSRFPRYTESLAAGETCVLRQRRARCERHWVARRSLRRHSLRRAAGGRRFQPATCGARCRQSR